MICNRVLNYFKEEEDKINIKKLLLIIFIAALTIRLLYGIFIFTKEGTTIFSDDWTYINYAKNMISQGIFVPDIPKTAQGTPTPKGLKGGGAIRVGPGFPFIVAFTFMVFGENYLPIILLNALISALLCVLIFYIAKEFFNERVGLYAASWSIFFVLFIKYTPRVLKENWLAFLFPLIIFLFLKETKKNKIASSLIILSILYTFFIHMDERFFAFFPVFLMGFIFLDQNKWKKGIKKAFVFFSLVVVFMVPWLIRNYNVHKRVIILTERTARFTDKIFGYKQEVEKLKKKEKEELVLYEEAIKLLLEGKDVTYNLNDLHLLKKAIKLGYIPHKFTWIERWAAEFKEFWRPFRFKGGFIGNGYRFKGPSWSLKHNLSVGFTYGLLLPFFIIGTLFILKNKNRYRIFILLIIIVHTAIHVTLLNGNLRYKTQIDALIIIFTFYGLQQLYLKFRNWKMNKKT